MRLAERDRARPGRLIRVLVADGQTPIRATFAALLTAAPDMTVVDETGDGAAAVRLVRTVRPDVVLMDMRLPGRDGLSAAGEIATDPRLAGVRVVMTAASGEDAAVFDALRAGASGFLLKDVAPSDLLDAVRVVHRGDAALSPVVTRRLIDDFARRACLSGRGRDLSRLTDREREVLHLLASGLSNPQIAARLFLSPATVKTYVSRLNRKLEARHRAQLVVTAYESGLVRPAAPWPAGRA